MPDDSKTKTANLVSPSLTKTDEELELEEYIDAMFEQEEQRFLSYFNDLTDSQRIFLFRYAGNYFERTLPSFTLMKQYQKLEEACFFLIKIAPCVVPYAVYHLSVFGLFLSLPVSALLLAVGTISASIGLCFMFKRYLVEQTFRKENNIDNSGDTSKLSTQYLHAFGLWSHKEVQDSREKLLTPQQLLN